MAKVIDITSNEPHKSSEVICVKCGVRWYAVRHVDTWLRDLECKACGTGFVIETGEDITKPLDADQIKKNFDEIKELFKIDPLI